MQFDIRKIDTENEKHLKRTRNIKNTDKSNFLYFDEKLVAQDSGYLPFFIFSLEKIKDKYNLKYDEVLIMLYLKELWKFPLKITILSRTVNLKSFLDKEYIDIDYNTNSKRGLYKLSETGNEILSYLYKLLNKPEQFFMDNRETDVNLERKAVSLLSKLYDSKD